jgi:hypothetical protein
MSMDDEDRHERDAVFNDICEMIEGRSRAAVISALVSVLQMVLDNECTPEERDALIKEITKGIKDYPCST